MKANEQRRISVWQCLMLFLSGYVLLALLADVVLSLPVEVGRVLNLVDTAVCAVFAADFVVQLTKAKRKLDYLRWGWIDLISSIPSLPFLRIGRLARVVRILRLLRGVRSTRVIVAYLFENRARGTLATVALISFVVIVFSSIAVLNVETSPDSTIRTAEDALWWAVATVTTVGYGDVYPTTSVGRIIAAVLMITGIALFGTFTATIASFFVQEDGRRETARIDDVIQRLDSIAKRVERTEGGPTEQQASQRMSEKSE